MSELGSRIRNQVRASVENASREAAANVAATAAKVAGTANVGRGSHSISLYSDDHVTVITRDGQTEVIPHQVAEPDGPPVAGQS